MMIEQNTNYAYKLKYMDNPTFDKVRDLSTKFYRELPQALQDELYEALNRGIDILDSEPQMSTYLYTFGLMHQAKLNYAFSKLPKGFFKLSEISIIDYGCGLAIGTMCYADYLHQNNYSQQVKVITLVEPSEICLKRASLHASMFFPNAEIKVVNKKFDELSKEDIVCSEETATLHIFSNVLDLMSFDLERLSDCIGGCLKGFNQFICVGPYFNYYGKDNRMNMLCSLLDGDDSLCETFDKYGFNPDKAWTCEIFLFSKGECKFKKWSSIQSRMDIFTLLNTISSKRIEELPKEYQILKEISNDLIDRKKCINSIAEKIQAKNLLDCEEISVIDYGCGQGIASICLIDWLRKSNYDIGNIKSVKLIDKDEKMLEKASILFAAFFPEINVISYQQDLLSKDFFIECDSLLTVNLFSHILSEDFRFFDVLNQLILKGHYLFVHNIVLDEVSSIDYPDRIKSYYFDYVVNNILDNTGCTNHANTNLSVKKRDNQVEKVKTFRFAILSRTSINEICIPNNINNYTNLCPGEAIKKPFNVPQNLLWYDKPLANTIYCENLDDENKISFDESYISPLFDDTWDIKTDLLNPKTIKACAEQFYQGHICHALSCGLPCGQEIVSIYERAAEDGVTEAYNNLGILQFQNRIDNKNSEQKGIDYFKLAAEGGSDCAMINLASYYMEKGNLEMAFLFYNKAAEKGNVVALLNLAITMNFGLYGYSADLDKAEALYWQCLEEFEKEKEQEGNDDFIQSICCLNLILLLNKKGEHYLKLLDVYYKAKKPSMDLKYCKEIIQIVNTNRFSKDIDGILHLTEIKEHEKPYITYNRALFLYYGLNLHSYKFEIKKDFDSAFNTINKLVETIEDYEWDEKYRYLYSIYARWLNSHQKGQDGEDLIYWRKAAEINPDYACASITNTTYLCKDEGFKKDVWHKYAYSEGCKTCHECGDYDVSLRVCPKAQYIWAIKYENQNDEREKLLRRSAEQLYNPALFYFGFRKAIKEHFPSFKENGIFNIVAGVPPDEYKQLYSVLAEDEYYKNLQLASELRERHSQSIIPFVAAYRENKYNQIYWASVFNNRISCEIIKRCIFDFLKEKCNKSIKNYFVSKTLCEKQMIAISEDIAKMTDDTQFICLYANFMFEGDYLQKAEDFYLLAKEKGCPDLDSVLEDIKKQIIAEEFETTMMFLDHHDNNYDERDWMRDSWDAMTDGQYGDMPDGFDGDYDFLGY